MHHRRYVGLFIELSGATREKREERREKREERNSNSSESLLQAFFSDVLNKRSGFDFWNSSEDSLRREAKIVKKRKKNVIVNAVGVVGDVEKTASSLVSC